jgi:hypothetical protein
MKMPFRCGLAVHILKWTGAEMTQRNMIIGAVVLVVLVVLFYMMSAGTPEPEVTTDPATETEPVPAAPAN